MMQVFVYDGELMRERRRNWQGLVNRPMFLTWNGTWLVGGNPGAGDVVVCHRAERADVQAAFEVLAAGGVYVVRIAENNRISTPAHGNTYDRAKGVGNPVDPHFAACLRYFLLHLDMNRTPEWHLLEGPQLPDALLAYHLLALLPNDEAAVKAQQALAATVIAEVQAITNASAGIQPLGNINDPKQRRQFLRACS